MKVSPAVRGLIVEFEVDQGVLRARWRSTLRDNDALVVRRIKTTAAPSGSFTLRRIVPDNAGVDTLVARAKNLATGEGCTLSVSQ